MEWNIKNKNKFKVSIIHLFQADILMLRITEDAFTQVYIICQTLTLVVLSSDPALWNWTCWKYVGDNTLMFWTQYESVPVAFWIIHSPRNAEDVGWIQDEGRSNGGSLTLGPIPSGRLKNLRDIDNGSSLNHCLSVRGTSLLSLNFVANSHFSPVAQGYITPSINKCTYFVWKCRSSF